MFYVFNFWSKQNTVRGQSFALPGGAVQTRFLVVSVLISNSVNPHLEFDIRPNTFTNALGH